MSENTDPSRRDFLRVAVYGGVVLISAGVGAFAVSAPRVPAASGDLLPLGPLLRFKGLDTGMPLEARVTIQRRDGWRLRTRPQSVFILRSGEGATAAHYSAFSPVCPHAGCGVHAEAEEFVCPCHDARFGLDGARKSGPSPRDLDPLELEVREYRGEDWLYVRWQDFEPGRPERIARGA